MKANWKLIQALRSAADRIENDNDYSWMCWEKCNCGILAQELLGVSQGTLDEMLDISDEFKGWTISSKDICSTTGLPHAAIYNTLMEYGLEVGDFTQIEYLRGPNERLRTFDEYGDKTIVSNWMREKADLLEKQLTVSKAETKELVPVRV